MARTRKQPAKQVSAINNSPPKRKRVRLCKKIVKTGQTKENVAKCNICLDASRYRKMTSIECAHTFHEQCINKWLETNKKCPLCHVLTGEKTQNEENESVDMESCSEQDQDTDTEKDSEKAQDTDSEKVFERVQGTYSEKDSEQDQDTDSEKDSQQDQDTDIEKDSELDQDTDSEKDSELAQDTDSDRDSEQDQETNGGNFFDRFGGTAESYKIFLENFFGVVVRAAGSTVD